MKKSKKYVPPKCVEFHFTQDAKGQAACSFGSAPSPDDPCWNGNTPTGYDGECATGIAPEFGGSSS